MSLELSVDAGARRLSADPARGARLTALGPRLSLLIRVLVATRLLVLVAGAAGERLLGVRSHSVGAMLAAPVDRFDAGWYLQIARFGYGGPASPRVAFLPAYPALVRLAAVFTRSPVAAGALVSLVCFAVALVLLHRLTSEELGPAAADATVLLLCCAPLSFFFTAAYAESLLLMLTVAAFYAASRDRLGLASVLGAAAVLTRLTAIAMLGALLVVWWRSPGRRRRDLLWLAIMPAALAGWMTVLALTGHGAFGEFHAERVTWGRVTSLPPETVLMGLLAMATGIAHLLRGATIYEPKASGPLSPFAQNTILGVVLLLCLASLEACRRWMRPQYAVYAGLTLLLCLSSRFSGEPLDSFDRLALTIFPLWMVGGKALAHHRRALTVVCVAGLAGLVFYTMQYAGGMFVA